MRYRLWDIDLLIRRTVLYVTLTLLLGLGYLVRVALLQRLFTAVSRQSSSISLIASTLAIAALFSPLRRLIQDLIDRRFFRKKYIAEQALAEFARVARNETDLQALTGHLTSLVQETVRMSTPLPCLAGAGPGYRAGRRPPGSRPVRTRRLPALDIPQYTSDPPMSAASCGQS